MNCTGYQSRLGVLIVFLGVLSGCSTSPPCDCQGSRPHVIGQTESIRTDSESASHQVIKPATFKECINRIPRGLSDEERLVQESRCQHLP